LGEQAGENPAPEVLENSTLLKDLRDRVEGWLRKNQQKQSTLAADCGVDAADLAHFLSGQRRLPAYALANLAAALGIDAARLLVQWEYSQCRRRLQEHGGAEEAPALSAKGRGWRLAQDAFASALRHLPGDGSVRVAARGPGTLADWPGAFLPLVVFVGDRREAPPNSPADLLAASASMGDLYYLPRLQLPPETEIRSDKTAVIATSESLRTLVQSKNLLIIGSPAANLMARTVNGGACFSFHVTSEALTQAKEFQKVLEPIRYLPGELERYAGVERATPAEIEWSRRRRHMIYGFARSGILDPVDYEGLRATATTAHSDFGVVTLCRHPWSDQHVAIMAAGLHGPATAAAIKLLSQENAFVGRPLGGVFRVHVPIDAPWEQRYYHLNPEWDTHEYSMAKYEAAVNEFSGTRQRELEGSLKFWNPNDVTALLGLVGSHTKA
jgi:transcriptional regulator with XRE-family HTH domain